MRTYLFNRIANLAGVPARFGAAGPTRRIISTAGGDSPEKPFLLIAMGVEQPFPGMPASSKTATIPFTVWVHDDDESMLDIDDAARALKDNLPVPAGAVVGGMSVYEIKWTDTGQDGYDDHWRTNCRPVRFTMVTKSS